ncbi:SDR family NAD(P)-dependent oxidoreductase, partial [Klebsiella pneumoniae]
MTWENKVVIVTGGGGGIGRAIALRFGREGAHVVLVGRTLGKVQDVAAEIGDGGGSAEAMAADVSSESDVARVIADTLRIFGRIDVMIN